MSENKENLSVNNEPTKKKKSRFGMVLSIVVVVLAITFSFLVLNQKENYTVLNSSSKEVASKISKIKDYRKIKGYKILEDTGKHKLILISAGLTYDELASIEVLNVEFNKNKAIVTIKENINLNPEREVAKYPFIILKVVSSVNELVIKNELGEEYTEIIIGEEKVDLKEETDNKQDEEVEEDEEAVEDEEAIGDEEVVEDEEDEVNEEASEKVNVLTCTYWGRVDSNSIEVSVGDSYRTLNVEMVQNAFSDKEVGKTITLEYIDTDMGQKVIKVR